MCCVFVGGVDFFVVVVCFGFGCFFFFNFRKSSPLKLISNTSGSSNSFRETEMKVQMLTCLLSKEMCRSVGMLNHF